MFETILIYLDVIFAEGATRIFYAFAFGVLISFLTNEILKQRGSIFSLKPDSRLKTAVIALALSQIAIFSFIIIGFFINPIFIAFGISVFVFFNPVIAISASLSAFAFAKNPHTIDSHSVFNYVVLFFISITTICASFVYGGGLRGVDAIKDEISKLIATEMNDFEMIESRLGQEEKDRFYYNLATKNGDEAVCSRIGNTMSISGSWRDLCFSNFGEDVELQSDRKNATSSGDLSESRLKQEVEESKAEARDTLGEATLANLRSRAEIYAFSKLDVSYEGWCDAIEDTPPGLDVNECVDTEESWALSARTTGTNQLKCVDSENGIVDGAVSIESGLCEQGEIQVVTTSSGSDENQVTTKSSLTAAEIDRISNESIETIREVADGLDGIELQIVTTIPNLEPGKTEERQGMTFEPVGDYPVIMISGTAATRSDLAGGIYPYSKSFLNVLMNTPNFDALLPTSALTQADDIEFQMVVVVTGE